MCEFGGLVGVGCVQRSWLQVGRSLLLLLFFGRMDRIVDADVGRFTGNDYKVPRGFTAHATANQDYLKDKYGDGAEARSDQTMSVVAVVPPCPTLSCLASPCYT